MRVTHKHSSPDAHALVVEAADVETVADLVAIRHRHLGDPGFAWVDPIEGLILKAAANVGRPPPGPRGRKPKPRPEQPAKTEQPKGLNWSWQPRKAGAAC